MSNSGVLQFCRYNLANAMILIFFSCFFSFNLLGIANLEKARHLKIPNLFLNFSFLFIFHLLFSFKLANPPIYMPLVT